MLRWWHVAGESYATQRPAGNGVQQCDAHHLPSAGHECSGLHEHPTRFAATSRIRTRLLHIFALLQQQPQLIVGPALVTRCRQVGLNLQGKKDGMAQPQERAASAMPEA